MKPDMDIPAAVANAGVTRRPWAAPATKRLRTSAAESGAAGSFDLAELLS